MTLLAIGLALWMAAHLFKRVLPGPRAALGKAGRGLVALAIVGGLVLMVLGYRAAEQDYLYALPLWAWHANNTLMLIALFLMDVGRVRGVVRTKIRHPMLTAVVIWSVAHLLVNGDLPSVVLFGGMGFWALLEMVVINRAEGPWTPPDRGSWAKDGLMLAIAGVLYAAIAGIHYWLGHPVFVAAG